MRHVLALTLGIAIFCIPSSTFAQQREKFKPPEIKKVHVGFKTYKDEDETAYKVGLWTPIYVEVFGGSEGILPRPNQRVPYLQITTGDSDDVETTVELDCIVEPLKETMFLAYVKTGHSNRNSRDIKVQITAGRREIKPQNFEPSFNANVDAHLYLTLGPRMTDFHRAVKRIGKRPEEKDEDFRNDMQAFHHVAYESEVDRLPDRWFGYEGIDLLILGTDQRKFLTDLNNAKDRLRALAQWVRRGGRLVVPIEVKNQDAVHTLLKNEFAWQPPIPVVPPKVSAGLQFDRLTGFENWVGPQAGDAFSNDKAGIAVATLDPGNVQPGDWKVLAESGEKSGNVPLVAHVRYGLGQITYLAISLQDEHLFKWSGKEKFMQTVVGKLAPMAPANVKDLGGQRFGGRFDDGMTDPATQLLAELDKFGVTPIDFGYVALFIILYILIVGPLDFFLLKFVFKRLEWTWITFPAVVLGVSVIAYFAAYALKGKDLKINKVDIVDFDLRTSRDPKQAKVYGHSYFAILSPRIQNYTIGVEPNPAFWGEPAGKPRSVDMLTWLGRPSGGPGDMGRSGSGGFFRRPYEYNEEYAGLRGVPIPVWTTKAFTASWEQPLANTPFVHDLTYFREKNVVVSGKLENHLGVDLVDAWVFYDDKFYPIEGGLKSVKHAPAVRLELRESDSKNPKVWIGSNEANDDAPHDSAANANQTRIVKSFLIHERIDTQRTFRNHLLRPLDMGWRITEEPNGQRDHRVREAILFGRVRYPTGAADTMTLDAAKPLPTKLWLGDIPGGEREWPTLSGQLNQDTYVRVILPLRPDAK
jgi:hypothetical protein